MTINNIIIAKHSSGNIRWRKSAEEKYYLTKAFTFLSISNCTNLDKLTVWLLSPKKDERLLAALRKETLQSLQKETK